MLLNLLSISFNLFINSFIKSRDALIVSVLIVIPCVMLSGVFWDFNIMPQSLQCIGRFLPTRWIYLCIEQLQKGSSLINIINDIYMIIGSSIVLFMLSIIKFRLSNSYK